MVSVHFFALLKFEPAKSGLHATLHMREIQSSPRDAYFILGKHQTCLSETGVILSFVGLIPFHRAIIAISKIFILFVTCVDVRKFSQRCFIHEKCKAQTDRNMQTLFPPKHAIQIHFRTP